MAARHHLSGPLPMSMRSAAQIAAEYLPVQAFGIRWWTARRLPDSDVVVLMRPQSATAIGFETGQLPSASHSAAVVRLALSGARASVAHYLLGCGGMPLVRRAAWVRSCTPPPKKSSRTMDQSSRSPQCTTAEEPGENKGTSSGRDACHQTPFQHSRALRPHDPRIPPQGLAPAGSSGQARRPRTSSRDKHAWRQFHEQGRCSAGRAAPYSTGIGPGEPRPGRFGDGDHG